jgi:hypothetical protein
MDWKCEDCPNAEVGVACYARPTCKPRSGSKPKTFTAKDVLLYLFSDCVSWDEDIDGDAHDDGSPYTIVNHNIRIKDGHLEELLDMAGINDLRTMESVLEMLKRHNDADLEITNPTPCHLTELG